MLRVLTLAPSSCCIASKRWADVRVNVRVKLGGAFRGGDAAQLVNKTVSCVFGAAMEKVTLMLNPYSHTTLAL